ncbi:MAG TPA: hypothetical protein VFT19_08310 [Solirubrobacterales bacterium]|nr:hypothetical protein [Solirubrobacterales bacterium]
MAGGEPQRRLQAEPEEREETRARLLAAVAKAAGEQGYEARRIATEPV